ncbi:hypothetical protein [Euzebya tangerina]|uniref:hypothetical protein n=1 Tax=Euzebya tangerina TaxID=591198 RepID=UPI000E30F51A|nr:hypothetical protein [Euzebya tangerina]
MPANDPVQYQTFANMNDSEEWARALVGSVQVDRENRVVVVAGTCPRCDDVFEQEIRNDDITIEAVAAGATADNSRPRDKWRGPMRFTVACLCRVEHPGRPSGTKGGCGAAAIMRDGGAVGG